MFIMFLHKGSSLPSDVYELSLNRVQNLFLLNWITVVLIDQLENP